MAQSSYQYVHSQFPPQLEDCTIPYESVELLTSSVSPSEASTLSPPELDLGFINPPQGKTHVIAHPFFSDDILEYQPPIDFLDAHFAPCLKPAPQIPEDILDFVSSYAFSDQKTVDLDGFPPIVDKPEPVFPPPLCLPPPPPPPSEIERCTYSRHSAESTRKRKAITATGGSSSSSEQLKLKKRQSNRDAAYRYRQKLKEKNLALTSDLSDSVEAYQKAKMEYEKARDAFDALKKVVLDMGVVDPQHLFS